MKGYGTLRRRNLDTKGMKSLFCPAKSWILSDVQPHISIQLKRIFPQLKRQAESPFIFADTKRVASDLNWFLIRYPMLMTATDKAYLFEMNRRFKAGHAEVEEILMPEWRPPSQYGWREGKAARHYQQQPVAMMLQSGGVLCADGVGLGKTFVGMAALLAPGCLPAIVVCDRHLQAQWYNQIRANTTLTARVINTTQPHALAPADVLIFSYTQLSGWIDYWKLIKPRLVVWDEVQELRTGEGTMTQSIAKGISALRLAQIADYRIGLSATDRKSVV